MLLIIILYCSLLLVDAYIRIQPKSKLSDFPKMFAQSLMRQRLQHCTRVVFIVDKKMLLCNDEIESLIIELTSNESHVVVIGQLEPSGREPWNPNDYDSVRKYSNQIEKSTVRNIEMENRHELSMPPAKYSSQREVIFVLIGRRYSFKPTNYFVPDFPMIDPSPDDPLSYLSERMLQLKIILQRRRNSYFVFWNRYPTADSVLLHPMVFGLVYKLEIETSPHLDDHSKNIIIQRSHCHACPINQIFVVNFYLLNNGKFYNNYTNNFPNRGKIGNGVKLIMSAGYYETYLRPRVINNKLQFDGGFWAKLIEEVAYRLNFTYHLIFNTAFGFKLENCTFIGSVGDVYYGKADALACVGIIELLMQAADLEQGGHFGSLGIVTSLPDIIFAWNTVFKPFEMEVWIALILSTLFLSLLLWLTVWIMRKPRYREVFYVPKYAERRVLQFPAFSMLNQLNRCPVVPTIRPIATCWLFFSIIMYVIFGDLLMAGLIHPLKEKAINSVQELLECYLNKKCTMGYVNYNAIGYILFAKARSGTFKKIFDGLELFTDIEKCFRKAYTRKGFACITYVDGISYYGNEQYIDHNGRRLLHVAENDFFHYAVSIGVRLGHPLGPSISELTRYALQAGLIQHWFKIETYHYFKKGIENGKNRTSIGDDEGISEDVIPISLNHLFGIFIVLVIGSFLGSATFYMEHNISIKMEERRKVKQPNEQLFSTKYSTLYQIENFHCEHNEMVSRAISLG